MKKKLYLLFGLVLSLLLVGVVNAKEPYNLDFETEEGEIYAATNIEYKDGYLTFDADDNDTYITMYDKAGTVLKTKKISDKTVLYARAQDNDVYVIYVDDDGSYLALLDEELAIKESKELDTGWNYGHYNYVYDGVEYIHITDEEVYVVLSTDRNRVYAAFTNRDLSEDFEEREISGNKQIKKYYPEYRGTTIAYDLGFNKVFDYKDGYEVVGDYDYSKCPEHASPTDSVNTKIDCVELFIALIDVNEEEVLWRKTIADYDFIEEVKMIDDYVSAIVKAKGKTTILIYDLEGNLIQTIETKDYNYSRIIDTSRGFIVAKNTCPDSLGSNYGGGGATKSTQKAIQICSGYHQVYYLYREINTVVTEGKGKVETVSEQKPGEPVTFVVTPDNGYVIGVIKVTDVNGNVITFTKDDLNGNTFTMPTSDVTIEVEFLVQNANTADIAIVAITILAVLSSVILIINKRKIAELK